MINLPLTVSVALALIAYSVRVAAADVDTRPPDRLVLSANGSTLTGADHGSGGSVNWLHYFKPNAMFGIGGEHQSVGDARWNFGSIRGTWSTGEAATKSVFYGEVHYGSGDESGRDFDYAIAVLGLSQGINGKFSVQLEGRQIDIDRTHGNLPKLGITYLWNPRVLTSVSYAKSAGGNLGTELFTARLDAYSTHVNFILGGAAGKADPSVVNLQPGVNLPARNLREGFIGVGRTFARGELQLLGDYLKLADSKKVTVTLSYTAYLGSRGRSE